MAKMSTTSFTKKTLGLETVEPAVTPPPANGNTSFVKKPRLASKSKKREIPEGLWTKCPKCSTMVFDKELDENLKVCNHCQYHFPIGARLPQKERGEAVKLGRVEQVPPVAYPVE